MFYTILESYKVKPALELTLVGVFLCLDTFGKKRDQEHATVV